VLRLQPAKSVGNKVGVVETGGAVLASADAGSGDSKITGAGSALRTARNNELRKARSIRTYCETSSFLMRVSNQSPLGRPELCARRMPLKPLM
jgi:hypothetical protein